MYRIVINLLIGLVITALAVGPSTAGKTQSSSPAGASADAASPARKGPKAVFPKLKYEFEPVLEGVEITHDFIIENHGDAPLVIKNIRPD